MVGPENQQSIADIANQINQFLSFYKTFSFAFGIFFLGLVFSGPLGIFFSWSCYSLMKKIPDNQRIMPAWFCWLFIIPFNVGYVFQWIMLPFAIPRSLKKQVSQQQLNRANSLFRIGLVFLISLSVLSIAIFFIPYATLPLTLLSLIIWIIYWIKISRARKLLL